MTASFEVTTITRKSFPDSPCTEKFSNLPRAIAHATEESQWESCLRSVIYDGDGNFIQEISGDFSTVSERENLAGFPDYDENGNYIGEVANENGYTV